MCCSGFLDISIRYGQSRESWGCVDNMCAATVCRSPALPIHLKHLPNLQTNIETWQANVWRKELQDMTEDYIEQSLVALYQVPIFWWSLQLRIRIWIRRTRVHFFGSNHPQIGLVLGCQMFPTFTDFLTSSFLTSSSWRGILKWCVMFFTPDMCCFNGSFLWHVIYWDLLVPGSSQQGSFGWFFAPQDVATEVFQFLQLLRDWLLA